jgi:hypothetical protein
MQRTMGGCAVTTSLTLVPGATSPGAATLAYQSHRAGRADHATVESQGTGGTASVTCARHGQTRSATTSFSMSS